MPAADAPRPRSLSSLRDAAAACTRCPLYRNATQVVVGEGPRDAELMFVGEQPGDAEDREGRPFVGPAGRLFDRLAEDAGVHRRRTFVTNAVKHFKFAPRGKRRIHQKPDASEVEACRWWLEIEQRLIRPKLIVALGATAAQSLTGTGRGILKRRGSVEATEDGTPVFLTVHPSFLLRQRTDEARSAAREEFRRDLVSILGHLDRIRAA